MNRRGLRHLVIVASLMVVLGPRQGSADDIAAWPSRDASILKRSRWFERRMASIATGRGQYSDNHFFFMFDEGEQVCDPERVTKFSFIEFYFRKHGIAFLPLDKALHYRLEISGPDENEQNKLRLVFDRCYMVFHIEKLIKLSGLWQVQLPERSERIHDWSEREVREKWPEHEQDESAAQFLYAADERNPCPEYGGMATLFSNALIYEGGSHVPGWIYHRGGSDTVDTFVFGNGTCRYVISASLFVLDDAGVPHAQKVMQDRGAIKPWNGRRQ